MDHAHPSTTRRAPSLLHLLTTVLALVAVNAGCQGGFVGECPPGEVLVDGYCEWSHVGSAETTLATENPLDPGGGLGPLEPPTLPTLPETEPDTQLETISGSLAIDPEPDPAPEPQLETISGSLATPPSSAAPTRNARILNDIESRQALDPARLALLSQLEAESSAGVSVRIDAATGSIVLLQVELPGYAAGSDAHVEVAEAFLGRYMSLLDPRIQVYELVERGRSRCAPEGDGEAPSPGAVVFERELDGTPVLGGAITVRFGANGALSQIENSLPSATAPWHPGTGALVSGGSPTDVESAMAQVDHRVFVAKEVGEGAVLEAGILQPFENRTLVGVQLDGGELLGPWPISLEGEPDFPASARVHVDTRTALPDFISHRPHDGLEIASPGPISPQEVVYRYLQERPSIFRTGRPRCQFRTTDVRDSRVVEGVTFVRVAQKIGRYPVFGATLVFEIQGDRVMSIQGHTLPDANMSLEPSLGREDAEQIARNELLDQGFDYSDVESAHAELMIFPGELIAGIASPSSHLAFRVQFEHYVVFVDAIEGWVVYAFPLVSHASREVHDAGGNDWEDPESFTPAGLDGKPTWDFIGPEAEAAIESLERVHEMYGNLFRWNGQDGLGSKIVINIDVANLPGSGANAWYDPGSKQSFFNRGKAVGDVIGHEFTHGVVDHSSNLISADESGALNESYADIMGELIFPADAPGPWFKSHQSTDFFDPEVSHYGEYQTRSKLDCAPDELFDIDCDRGGVHANAGITNRAHAILSDGDGGVAGGDITGIGRHKLLFLVFDTMTDRLSRTSRMVDSALGTLAACEAILANPFHLLGAPLLDAADCEQVEAAFSLVGLAPSTVSSWVPVGREFEGSYTEHRNGTITDNACDITEVTVGLSTPDGLYKETATDRSGVTVDYHGIMSASVPETAPPIGTNEMPHTLHWSFDHGKEPDEKLRAFTSLLNLPPEGDSDCYEGSGIMQKPKSHTREGTWWPCPLIRIDEDLSSWCSGETRTGKPRSRMDVDCKLVKTEVELYSPRRNRWVRDDRFVEDWQRKFILGHEARLHTAVWMGSPPTGYRGSRGRDLAADVYWGIDPFVDKVRWRLVYHVVPPADAPAGYRCKP